MSPDEHLRDDARDLLALGAAGALSDDEYRVLEERLAADPALAAEYRELQAGATVLAEATTEAPPPSLRASVLDAVKSVEQLPAAPPHPNHAAPSNTGGEPLGEPTPCDSAFVSSAEPAEQAKRELDEASGRTDPLKPAVPIHHRRWMIPATAAAAVVMLLVLGLLVNRFADAPSSDRMSAVLNDDDAATYVLSGSLAGLRLVSSEDENAAVLMGTDVAMPNAGMVFQLWAIHPDEMVGMATFKPAATGEVAMVIDDAGVDAQWAVTMEPEGGSDQPTSDPIAVSA